MNTYSPVNVIRVGLNFKTDTIDVGRLASRSGKIYFEYDERFLKANLNISPLKLPLQSGLKSFDPFLFEGLPGVFNDSLPDGWGRLLIDRLLRNRGLIPGEFTVLDRLAFVGFTGIGALVYEPDHSEGKSEEAINLDTLAGQTQMVLEGEAEGVLEELIELNGSSAGARPKALIGIDQTRERIIHGKHGLAKGFEPWIVKFANSQDGTDAGAIEYVYSLMVKQAGVKMMETHLFPSATGAGYFATRRFDRVGESRNHVHTASGLLHSDFRSPSLDYENLLELTGFLTKDIRETENMFRQAVFNVLSHNRDDHGKNFSFLMDQRGEWKLSPAYDLTFSSGPNGEQSTMVMGEGQKPTIQHLVRLGQTSNFDEKMIKGIIDQTREALSHWPTLAANYGVRQSSIKLIQSKISQF